MSSLLEPVASAPAAHPELETLPSAARRGWWWAMLVASLLGVVSGTITVVEKIALLKDPGRSSICDVNGAIGCTPVLLAPQSSVLGPPNAALGIVMFGMLAAAGLAGVMGTTFPRSYRWFLLGLSTFFGMFLTWYMWQVGFAIGSLCPFCAVCAGCVMVTTLAAWRMATVDVPHDARGLGGALATARRSGLDVIVVVGWTLLIAGILVVGIAF